MKKKIFLYCYKMTHDTGFAPNPYQGVLTLATCKPTIRRCADVGYWISGWTSNQVQGKTQKFNFKDEPQKLIYLAKVTDKISMADYWVKFPQKRSKGIDDAGDNIYEPTEGDAFRQHKNGGGHGPDNKKRDLSGKFVLICEEFYYFGVENAIEIKNKSYTIPRCKKFSLEDNEAKTIIEYVTKRHPKGLNLKKK